jgi:hypothetical protein
MLVKNTFYGKKAGFAHDAKILSAGLKNFQIKLSTSGKTAGFLQISIR